MVRSADDILTEALALSPEDRAALADALIESLDGDVADQHVEAAWSAEIARRVAEADSGKAEFVPWSEVRRRLFADE